MFLYPTLSTLHDDVLHLLNKIKLKMLCDLTNDYISAPRLSFAIMNTSGMTTSKNGAPIGTVTQFTSFFVIHPDHSGFVIGKGGATVKKIGRDTRTFVGIQKPNDLSNGMPWFLIKGDIEANVATAYHRIRTIAQEAERRMPRMNGTATKPRAKLNVVSGPRSPSPPPEPEKEVTVIQKQDKDGKTWLVDESSGDVYEADGMLIGHMKDGVVFSLNAD